MTDAATYHIVARITASGVIERSDVVGAIFGQTDGLLGNDLELRSSQAAGRVGRMQVEVESENGVSTGTIIIGTTMDRVETAVLAASLETIDRIGPCYASVEVERIEDVRAAKRRHIVDRATELIEDGFDDIGIAGRDLVTVVRETTMPVELADFHGYPAGPAVGETDELIVVEGRSDVRRLLRYGIDHVVGVEGTNVPDEIASLTEAHTVTAFFDGDRGGNLLLLELAQVGDVDYVTFAPPGEVVEELSGAEIREALAERVPYEPSPAAIDDYDQVVPTMEPPSGTLEPREDGVDAVPSGSDTASTETPEEPEAEDCVHEHVADESIEAAAAAILDADPDTILLLDEGAHQLVEASRDELAARLDEHDACQTVLINGPITQVELDVAARHDVPTIIGHHVEHVVKRPISVHVATFPELDIAPVDA